MPLIETVRIEDVYPLEDEYGNRIASRDYSTKANRKYVEELARSMKSNGGVPDELVTLVRDGGIYRIKAGNSRVEAMRMLGTKSFPAVIDEDDTVQSVLETVIRTNTKKKYEAVEESRFVQQLAMFGSDEYVSDVSGIEAEKVKRIRIAAEAVGDAIQDMSIPRAIAIGEFEEIGCDEAVYALQRCTEKDYPAIAERYRAMAARAEAERELVAAMEGRGIGIVESADGMRLLKTVRKPSEIPSELPDGTVAAKHGAPGFYMLMHPAAGDVVDECERGRADYEAMMLRQREGAARRAKWIASKFATAEGLGELKCLCACVREDPARFGERETLFMRLAGIDDMPVGPSDIARELVALEGCILRPDGEPDKRACGTYVGLLDTMERDGYEPDEAEQEIYQTALDAMEVER